MKNIIFLIAALTICLLAVSLAFVYDERLDQQEMCIEMQDTAKEMVKWCQSPVKMRPGQRAYICQFVSEYVEKCPTFRIR